MCRAVIAEVINSSIREQIDKANGIVETDPPLLSDAGGNPVVFSVQTEIPILV
jgi:hypothetical protein